MIYRSAYVFSSWGPSEGRKHFSYGGFPVADRSQRRKTNLLERVRAASPQSCDWNFAFLWSRRFFLPSHSYLVNDSARRQSTRNTNWIGFGDSSEWASAASISYFMIIIALHSWLLVDAGWDAGNPAGCLFAYTTRSSHSLLNPKEGKKSQFITATAARGMGTLGHWSKCYLFTRGGGWWRQQRRRRLRSLLFSWRDCLPRRRLVALLI